MIHLKEIAVTFNPGTALEKKALNGLDLKISQGEFVTVIGGNGAGKSTLLATLCGEVLPTSGQVLIDDVDVTTWPVWKRTSFVARVFQDPMVGTCSNLSIEENMALASRRTLSRGLAPALNRHDKERLRHALSRLALGLENRLKDPMGSLSGGQRQAVSLVMSALAPMKILALDEHTAALDPKTGAFIMDLTRQIIEEHGLTALMVTHSMTQALQNGTRTVMINAGRVVYDAKGAKRESLTSQDLIALFHKSHGEADLLT